MNKKSLFILLCVISISFLCGGIDESLNIPFSSPTPWLVSRFDLLPCLPKGGIVAEIGVQRGDFSALILRYANPKKLYLIDCWEHQSAEVYQADGGNVENEKQLANYEWIKQRFGDDPRVKIIKAYSDEANKLFEDNFFDWVYIDANHSYDAVKDDLELWYPKIKPGGFLVGDDYVSPFIRPAFGVVLAVNEFMKKYFLTLSYLTIDTFANWAIKKPH